MGSENIFDIWRFLGKGTPFIVRRNGWFHLSYKVTKEIPKEGERTVLQEKIKQ